MDEHGDTQGADAHDAEEPDGYHGAAAAVVGDTEHQVELALSGHFEPISGSYTWYGRVRGLPETANGTAVLVRVTEDDGGIAEAEATVSERDLWDHHLVSGIGAPPFLAFDTSVL
ncbi:MAG: DUF4873 domain-containing protein [Actinomycetota bacterium]|nr:DUF4873 domain-containing protein [Actinomycetota bacterium]